MSKQLFALQKVYDKNRETIELAMVKQVEMVMAEAAPMNAIGEWTNRTMVHLFCDGAFRPFMYNDSDEGRAYADLIAEDGNEGDEEIWLNMVWAEVLLRRTNYKDAALKFLDIGINGL
jgi:hypothetical protein